MADGAVKAGKVLGSFAPLAMFTDASGGILSRKIEFHRARRSFSGFGFSGGETLRPDLDPDASSVSQRNGSDAGAVHGGLDPELRFETTFRRIGASLANLGNTCFLNSVLQCLTYAEPLAAYLLSGKHKSSCRTAGFCALCALQDHIVEALQSTGKTLKPSHLVKNLRCVSRNFRNARQEDAHEYMINLLEAMHKCSLPSGVSTGSTSAYEKSLIHKIFGGRLRSQVKCVQCSYSSSKLDPFLDLSLEIVKADNLGKALSSFVAEEHLDGGEKEYHCPQCDQKVNALKKLTVEKAPYVLVIHLKRFGSHVSGQKIGKQVDFDPELNLRPYVSNPLEEDLEYRLYGVLVHAGYGMHSGHYFCFVRTSSGMWYSLNDEQVSQVSEKTVLQQKAYMLFYVRKIRSFPKKGNDQDHYTKKVSASLNNTDAAISSKPKCDFIESNNQPTAKARENNKDTIISKKRGRRSSYLKNISFGPRRFLLLSLVMRRKKRAGGKGQTLTCGGIRKTGIPEVNADSEREERELTSSSSSRNVSSNPLTSNLREISVPRWDDVELPPKIQIIDDDDEPRSIGYLLDEEEKEYDRGRRKKVRTRNDSFGGPNLFEELALTRTQKKIGGRR